MSHAAGLDGASLLRPGPLERAVLLPLAAGMAAFTSMVLLAVFVP